MTRPSRRRISVENSPPDDFHPSGQEPLKVLVRDFIQMMFLMHVPDQISHRWSLGLDELIGYSPHLLERPVDDLAAQVRAHEEHRIIDRFENCIKLIE